MEHKSKEYLKLFHIALKNIKPNKTRKLIKIKEQRRYNCIMTAAVRKVTNGQKRNKNDENANDTEQIKEGI